MSIKAKAMDGAMKFMQSDKGQKLMANPDIQKAIQWAFQTSFKVQSKVGQVKRDVAKKFAVATEDDLKELKRTMDRLERKVKKMNEAAKANGAAPAKRTRKKKEA